MLTYQQNSLLLFLTFYRVTDKESCYIAMGYSPGEYLEASYSLRPLMRYGYITRRSDSLYSITHKGKKFLGMPWKWIVSCGGDETSRKRAAYIAKTAAILDPYQVFHTDKLPIVKELNWFVPSPCWRKIRQGLISTVRFAGILFMNEERLAVYHIGDGNMDWQTYAERSLFFQTYGKW